MLFMNDGRSGLLGRGRERGQAWSPEIAALAVAAAVLLALVL